MALDKRGHIGGAFWYNDQKGLAFFAIPKNASTALRNCMIPTDAGYYPEYKLPENVTKFSVLRNPVDRCVSAYLEVIKRAHVDCIETTRKDFFRMPENKKRFIGFLDEIELNGFWEVHAQPQSFYLSDQSGNLIDLDYVFIFEDLSSGLKRMAEETGKILKPKREWAHSLDQKRMVNDYLDDDLKNKIKNIYKTDWELYEKTILSK